MNRHLRTHTEVKPYDCDHCCKSFSRSDVLQTHLRTHTGDKPYKCEECGKSVSRKRHMQTHLRAHKNSLVSILPMAAEATASCLQNNSDEKDHVSPLEDGDVEQKEL